MHATEYSDSEKNAWLVRLPPVWRGLLLREWLVHGGRVEWLFALWLIALWVLPVLCHPKLILAFGALYALLLGSAVGGSDTVEDCEEFSLALPPTRSEVFWARLAFGAAPLAAMSIVGVAAVALGLPQKAWGLVVETGFTEPFPPVSTPWWHMLAAAGPVWLFVLYFSAAALARSRATLSAYSMAAKVTTAVVFLVALTEMKAQHVAAETVVAVFSIFCLLTLPLIAWCGWILYLRKEAGFEAPEAGNHARRGMGAFAILILVVVLLLFLSLFFVRVGRVG